MKSTGLVYTSLSSLFLSTSFISIKYFLQYTNTETLNVIWFSAAFLLSFAFLLVKNSNKVMAVFKKNWKAGLLIGGANALSSILFIESISRAGPTPTAFVVRFSAIFLIFLGILVFKEKLHSRDLVGMVIAVGGALLISFGSGNYLNAGVLLALAAAFMMAVNSVLMKVYIKSADPLSLTCLQSLYTAILLLVYALIFSKIRSFPAGQLPLVAVAVTVSVILSLIFYYKALQLLNLSKIAIIRTLEPFMVAVLALIVFRTLPSTNQLVGGTLVVIGVFLTIVGYKKGVAKQ